MLRSPRFTVLVAPLAAALALATVGASPASAATAPAGPTPVVIGVQGGPLASLAVSPTALVPQFSQAPHDYVVHCAVGTNDLTLTLGAPSGDAVGVGTRWGQSLDVPVSVVEGQAVVLQAQDASGAAQEYWVRCLPHDFPVLDVSRPGSPAPGWYLMGSTITGGGDSPYAMILDNNGTPVWYGSAPGKALGVQAVTPTVVAWSPNLGGSFGVAPNNGISVVQMDGSGVEQVTTVGVPTDHHEFLQLPGGGHALISYPLKSGVDLTSLGLGSNQTIADCVLQELDANGNLVWQWRASEHVDMSESEHPGAFPANGGTAYDVFHCNSIDEDGAGHVLVSARHLSAVLQIDHATGTVQWKLGGTPSNKDGARILTIHGDPETTIDGQHDARYMANGDISIYDDHTWLSGAARGVEYSLDTNAGTATFVWQYAKADAASSPAMGSFRRYADGSNVVGWGLTAPAFTDVDDSGNVQLEVSFHSGGSSYRVTKVPPSTFDVATLHRTAGLDSQPSPAPGPGAADAGAPGSAVGMAGSRDVAGHQGYWAVTAAGQVGAFGIAGFHGDLTGQRLNAPVVGMAVTPDRGGYWLAAADGGVFAYGDAAYLGSMGGVRLNQPIVGIASSADGQGYWLVAADGGVFAFGDAPYRGSMGAVRLNQPVVGMAASRDGAGYWMVARDGGIFAFGDAPYLGSMGAVRLNQPVVGMATRPDADGYWLVASDGGVFAFSAPFHGSLGGTTLAQPIAAMAASGPDGYWMLGRDGGVFAFGNAQYLGRIAA